MTQINLAQFTDLFPWIIPPEKWQASRYNVAPTQPVAAAVNHALARIEYLLWGLIPSWAGDPAIGATMINARAETLAQKRSFARCLKRRRCLIPTSGFYEWRADPGGRKAPMFIRMKDEKPFALAGLWDVWHGPEGSQVTSCTVITTAPNELVKAIHDRMPAIVPPEEYRLWLSPQEGDPAALLRLLGPYPADNMQASEVSTRVNNVRFDDPQCLEPASRDQGMLFG
ncbi:MAG: SOS response-associated peptidase [Tepidisphaeraceae bacterium]|jgi:putative SOS response-associated peptidase YedK